jgi:hypothetical protein
MMDTRALLAGLEAYRDSLDRHVASLHLDFDEVGRAWLNLDECFAGSSADEFRPIWEGTAQQFRDYVDHTSGILRILGDRIESLREADRPTGLGG